MEFCYGAGRTRAMKFVVTRGATHANRAGHPESVSAFRQSAAVAPTAAVSLATTASTATPTATPTAKPTSTSTPTAALPAPAPQPTTHADYLTELRAQGVSAICNDGTLSYSRNRSGTCSHHDGVREWTGLI